MLLAENGLFLKEVITINNEIFRFNVEHNISYPDREDFLENKPFCINWSVETYRNIIFSEHLIRQNNINLIVPNNSLFGGCNFCLIYQNYIGFNSYSNLTNNNYLYYYCADRVTNNTPKAWNIDFWGNYLMKSDLCLSNLNEMHLTHGNLKLIYPLWRSGYLFYVRLHKFTIPISFFWDPYQGILADILGNEIIITLLWFDLSNSF